MMTQILERFEKLFPLRRIECLWAQIESRRYRRAVQAPRLIETFFMALLMHEPSLEAVALRWGWWLGSYHASTLSYALSRPSSLALAQRLFESLNKPLAKGPPWRRGQLVALDSMALTVQASRLPAGSRTPAINPAACGGAVLWGMALNTTGPAENPLRILRIVRGPWHDSVLMNDIALIPNGPIYLMDMGFWSLAHVREWTAGKVRFILRVHRESLVYESLEECGAPRSMGKNLWIDYDGVALVGSAATHSIRPRVRLLMAHSLNAEGREESIALLSSEEKRSAERLLENYRLRGRIECFHRMLKESVGLAHLYSFHESGIFFLLHVALMLVMVALVTVGTLGSTVASIQEALHEMRFQLGIATTHWHPNTARPVRGKGRKRKRRRKQPTNQDSANP